MALKKCPTCGTVYRDHHRSCPTCDYFRYREHTMLESCTGVRYPCTHSCNPCYFEKIYGENRQT